MAAFQRWLFFILPMPICRIETFCPDWGMALCCVFVFVFVCATAVARNKVAMRTGSTKRKYLDALFIEILLENNRTKIGRGLNAGQGGTATGIETLWKTTACKRQREFLICAH
jgi:hypothetical protein